MLHSVQCYDIQLDIMVTKVLIHKIIPPTVLVPRLLTAQRSDPLWIGETALGRVVSLQLKLATKSSFSCCFPRNSDYCIPSNLHHDRLLKEGSCKNYFQNSIKNDNKPERDPSSKGLLAGEVLLRQC